MVNDAVGGGQAVVVQPQHVAVKLPGEVWVWLEGGVGGGGGRGGVGEAVIVEPQHITVKLPREAWKG